ncbi:MAG: MarR family transcriptional regulator [Planctomycetota bacterium]
MSEVDEQRVLNPEDRTIREAQDRFIDTWGRMGSAWGISRTMAEAHALLYITGLALNTDEVMERLEISRGNASMSLRALQDWGLVERVHKRGDRKEYYQAESDVWTIFRTIAEQRKKRELEPVVASLYELRDMTKDGSKRDKVVKHHNERLDSMLEFMQTLDTLSSQLVSPEGKGLKLALTLLSKAM